jgi:hypothetical protein
MTRSVTILTTKPTTKPSMKSTKIPAILPTLLLAACALLGSLSLVESMAAQQTAAQQTSAQEPTAQEPAPPAGQSTAPAYTPKYHGDPARSDSEFAALAYMRVVMRAQMLFNKHYGHYATSLTQLVHTGTFTQRMVNPDRGDYTAEFKSKKDNYVLTMTPKNPDAQHRSFYAEDDGKIHADETKPADENSQVVETHKW